MLDGHKRSLSDLRGQPVVLVFWATWCGPCIESMPELIQLAQELDGRMELIAINQQEDPQAVRDFLESRQWKLNVALDADRSANRIFGVDAIPYTMVLDPSGGVRYVGVGAAHDRTAKLREVLSQWTSR
jgi:thiol-disulfide isomerase/thioredoxin